ncbi:GNAT family N-acetyltransferase [Pontixanthobacter aestiaquae]|uniref:GNAT family N-acetyltransferase n=1 Tax=Pontixanthobacter aestiaquae TaxID=1509367 RepID=A0A844Z1C7_9SPHN|nr:GNAT family N-acetyltransferase [Pontixanthobacter aestiaquae]MDN3646481.1 GNAT family N-acetyltransferase [Pontixanthobacter aestiaquae]MXO82531.1 GNAT family N-acetyltransferase [Pontixanthobacter aestiaquae]
MTGTLHIIEDDLSGEAINALLTLHLEEMHKWSPACKVHAMPVERLREEDVTFYAAWSGGDLAACGALKELGDGRGELKSMRASPAFRGQGAGEAILLHLLAEAERRGYHWLGLETGRPTEFFPAQKLYEKHGFAECEPFGNYVSDEFSLCMSRTL